METYNFKSDTIDNLANLIDSLSVKEAEKVIKSIQTIQEQENITRRENDITWFQTAILPILKDFAELNTALLEVESKNFPIISVTFRNDDGFCLTESCLGMKILFVLAIQLGFEKDGSDFALTIVFDCSKIL